MASLQGEKQKAQIILFQRNQKRIAKNRDKDFLKVRIGKEIVVLRVLGFVLKENKWNAYYLQNPVDIH